MTQQFRIGDTVTVKSEEDTLYIVSNVVDYETLKGSKFVKEYDYELILILPVKNGIKTIVRTGDDLLPYAKYQNRMWETMMEFIRKDRAKNNLFGEPPFLKIIQDKLMESVGLVKVQIPRIALRVQNDEVNYSSLETVDQCLDAIIDLNMLHKMFKDKEFLASKKVVKKRLKQLLQKR